MTSTGPCSRFPPHSCRVQFVRYYAYLIYGVRVETDFPLPEMAFVSAAGRSTKRKVSVRTGVPSGLKPRNGWVSWGGLQYWFSPDHEVAWIRSPMAGDFQVRFSEKEIHWIPARKNFPGLAPAVLRSKVLGLLLPHLGASMLLHGNVVEHQGKAFAFCGPVGQGKSTLTAFLLNQEFSLLSDDIACIFRKGEKFFCESGTPEIRLWPPSVVRLMRGGIPGEPLLPHTKKKRFYLTPNTKWNFERKPVFLRAVFLLARKRKGRGVQVEKLTARDALTGLLANAYCPVVKDPFVLRLQFKEAAALVRTVPVKRLVYPSGFLHLSRVRQALLPYLGSCS